MITYRQGKKRPYRADIRIKVEGKTVRVRKTFYYKRTAQRWVVTMQADSIRGIAKIIRKKDRVSLQQAGDSAISYFSLRLASSTIEKYKIALQHACKFFGKNRKLDEINRSKLGKFVAWRREAGIQPSTINNEVSSLRQIFLEACQQFRSLDDWQPPKVKPLRKPNRGRTRTISDDEFDRLTDDLEQHNP